MTAERSKKRIIAVLVLILFIGLGVFTFIYTLPINRVGIHSELVMLGDLNNDNKWDEKDKGILSEYINDPFAYTALEAVKIDINRNGQIDIEDTALLKQLCKYSDPYIAETKSFDNRAPFPRPREFFRYVPKTEYLKRPLYALRHEIVSKSPLSFLRSIQLRDNGAQYEEQLLGEIYNEGIRFSIAFDRRSRVASAVEKKYAEEKIRYCNALYSKKDYYNLLLNLISLVEDAETLTVDGQDEFIAKILYFRDNLKGLLQSPFYADYLKGKRTHEEVFESIEIMIARDLNMEMKLLELQPPRNILSLRNYIDRAEWQFFKSSTQKNDFMTLLLYAQYDARYLRAVSKTSRRHGDIGVENHNLPMILLFREALRIKNGNKKSAVGLLDEAIRIPFAWVKSIPREKLPTSIALENFLLPGNKEDGSDKSRHWNVFGGIALYKSPEASLTLALQREMKDLRESGYAAEVMTEFIRDTIANINGIYYVVSINPELVYKSNVKQPGGR